jgi:hypothetical protein
MSTVAKKGSLNLESMKRDDCLRRGEVNVYEDK